MSRTTLAAAPADLLLRGATVSYLVLLVVLPILAMTLEAARPGAAAFWAA